MRPEDTPPPSLEETLDLELSPADQRLWDRLSSRLSRPDRPGLCLSEATVAGVTEACPPVPVSPALRRRLGDLGERAARDLEFETALGAGGRRPTLGAYLVFLRQQASLTAAEAARRFRLDFQFLADLEHDRLRPHQIPARRLANLVRRLKGSLEQTERLLAGTIRAQPTLLAAGSGRLYRTAAGARPADAEAASLAARGEPARYVENPEYQEEVEVLRRLLDEVRTVWHG